MRAAITIILSFLLNFVSGQDLVDRLVYKSLCDCMPHILEISKDSETMIECMVKSIGKDSIELQNELEKKYGVQAEEMFFQLGQQYFTSNSVELIDSCDTYFHIMDTMRLLNFQAYNKDSLIDVLNKFNKTDDYYKDTSFYYHRGICYFSLGEYANALSDLSLSSDNAKNITKMSIIALATEFNKEYDRAISMYNNLFLLTNINEYKIFAAIAKRKKNRL